MTFKPDPNENKKAVIGFTLIMMLYIGIEMTYGMNVLLLFIVPLVVAVAINLFK